MKIYLLIISILLFSGAVLSHGGGLDSNGGHHDRKRGGYHCHREPCFSNQKKTKAATQEAIINQRPVSLIYDRKSWRHWSDFDNDCMNTRHEILNSQADAPVKLSPDGCYVSSSVWIDPYSGGRYTRASDLDIDHVVALSWAHEHGGANWPSKKKEAFANDPLNLLAVDDGLNQAKGADGPDKWLPPNKKFVCEYLSIWKRVLVKYSSLKMTANEESLFKRQLSSCKH